MRLAYDQISPFMLSTPLAVFGGPFLASGHRVDVCAGQRRISATGGLTIEASFPLETAREADILILPSWRDADEPVPATITFELRAAEARGAIVAGLCLGAFGLAEAGLLDGRRATTHWARVDTFAARYPKVTVDMTLKLFQAQARAMRFAADSVRLPACAGDSGSPHASPGVGAAPLSGWPFRNASHATLRTEYRRHQSMKVLNILVRRWPVDIPDRITAGLRPRRHRQRASIVDL